MVSWYVVVIIIIIIITHRVLVEKPEEKRPLGRFRYRWEDNIKVDLQEVGGWLWGLDGVG